MQRPARSRLSWFALAFLLLAVARLILHVAGWLS